MSKFNFALFSPVLSGTWQRTFAGQDSFNPDTQKYTLALTACAVTVTPSALGESWEDRIAEYKSFIATVGDPGPQRAVAVSNPGCITVPFTVTLPERPVGMSTTGLTCSVVAVDGAVNADFCGIPPERYGLSEDQRFEFISSPPVAARLPYETLLYYGGGQFTQSGYVLRGSMYAELNTDVLGSDPMPGLYAYRVICDDALWKDALTSDTVMNVTSERQIDTAWLEANWGKTVTLYAMYAPSVRMPSFPAYADASRTTDWVTGIYNDPHCWLYSGRTGVVTSTVWDIEDTVSATWRIMLTISGTGEIGTSGDGKVACDEHRGVIAAAKMVSPGSLFIYVYPWNGGSSEPFVIESVDYDQKFGLFFRQDGSLVVTYSVSGTRYLQVNSTAGLDPSGWSDRQALSSTSAEALSIVKPHRRICRVHS